MTYAAFTICGPEYIAMVAAETKAPRSVLPAAYSSFKYRLLFFFCGAALAMGIMVPYDDPTLNGILDGDLSGGGTSAASPFVIAMDRLNIPGLPHFFNAIVLTSVFSAGNSYVFSSSRILYFLANEGRAPNVFLKTTKNGVPIYAVFVSLTICLLCLLNVSDNTTDVLGYFIDIVTTNGLLCYMTTCFVYIHFYFNMKKQGISRDSLPYRSRLQPYAAYLGIFGTICMALLLGFDCFLPGGWSIKWFMLDYTFLAVYPIMYLGWKFWHKTKYVPIGTADLGLGGDVKAIDDYEDLIEVGPLKGVGGWSERIFGGISKRQTKLG